ncbi:methylated-DNA--[protein]-cysteine S-methyltransferase [Aquirufa sp. ROCK2-A2]
MTTNINSTLSKSFIQITRLTEGESGKNGKNLQINYQILDSIMGKLLIASTDKGICQIDIISNEDNAIELVKKEFPEAYFIHQANEQSKIIEEFLTGKSLSKIIQLHIKGTDFQINVWNALLDIPFGKLSNYGVIAQKIGNEKASRAVGTAIGSNPIALLIPCHRVVQASGKLGGFKWGIEKKAAIIAWETNFGI